MAAAAWMLEEVVSQQTNSSQASGPPAWCPQCSREPVCENHTGDLLTAGTPSCPQYIRHGIQTIDMCEYRIVQHTALDISHASSLSFLFMVSIRARSFHEGRSAGIGL